MRKSKSAYIAVVILLGLAGVAVMSVTMGSGRQAGPEFISDFRAASILYEKGKYAEAVEAYERLLKRSSASSAELFFNLGNAYFKNDQVGRAILNYFRAQKLKPSDRQIKYNLDIALRKARTNPVVTKRGWFGKLYAGFAGQLSAFSWAWVTLTLYWIAAAVTVLLIYLAGRWGFLRTFCVILVVCFTLSSGVTLLRWLEDSRDDRAVVIKNAEAKFDHTDDEEIIFNVGEGTLVRIAEEYDGWYQIKIEDGKLGWIKAESLGIL